MPAVGARDLRAVGLRLDGLLQQAHVHHGAEPDERDRVQRQQHDQREQDRELQLDHCARQDQQAGQRDRVHRLAQPPERSSIPHRRPVAQPEGSRESADGRHGQHGQRDRDVRELDQPGPDLTRWSESVSERVECVHDQRAACEGHPRPRPEGRAVECVVEAPIGQEDQRAGEHQRHAEQRQQDPAREQLVAVALREQPRAGRRDGPHQERVADAGRRSPEQGDRNHPEGLVLVDVHVDEVEDRQRRDQHRAGDEPQRKELGQAECEHHRQAAHQGDPESDHRRLRELREQTRHHARAKHALPRVGGEAPPPGQERLGGGPEDGCEEPVALGHVLPELVPAHHAEVAVRYLVVARRTPHRAAILRQR